MRSSTTTPPTSSTSQRLAHLSPALHFPLHADPCSWVNAVETFFPTLTCRRLHRGAFYSLVDLQAAINGYLEEHNQRPKPFVWTADPDCIIEKVNRGHQTLASDH